MDGNEPDTPEP